MEHELLFICPTFSHFDVATKCLKSFAAHSPRPRAHIMVIDDASADWWQSKLWLLDISPLQLVHHTYRGGLTRSWNEGLRVAKMLKYKYAICGNSDLLFSDGWYQPLLNALELFDLVGPVSNAPGHATWQAVSTYADFTPTDNPAALDDCAHVLRQKSIPPVAVPFVNGFCMAAKTDTWWQHAFDGDNVFNPAFKLIGNEDEFQMRMKANTGKIGCVPSSFVFHYRSVSRPSALQYEASKGAYRANVGEV